MKHNAFEAMNKDLIENLKFRKMQFPKQFELIEGVREYKTKKIFKFVQEYKNYARYVDIRTGLFECFNKSDFKNNISITILEE